MEAMSGERSQKTEPEAQGNGGGHKALALGLGTHVQAAAG